MTHVFDIAGFTFSVATVVAVAAVVQFVIVLIAGGKRAIPISALIFAGAWLAIFSANKTAAAQAAVIAPAKSHGSCSSITEDMPAADVKTKLGDPDETRSEEETRGPGAAMWIYRDSRCAVHILDDKVEFID